MFESILVILGIMLFCVAVLSPFYFFRKKNTGSVPLGVVPSKNKAFYWFVFVICAVVGSQAYSWFNFSIVFSAIVQTLAVFLGIFAIRKIWTSRTAQETPREIPGQESHSSKVRKYLAFFAFIILVGIIVIPRFITQNLRSEINVEELKVNLEKSGEEFDALRQELDSRGLMSTLEEQEGKPFKKIPMNVIKDFLNQNGN